MGNQTSQMNTHNQRPSYCTQCRAGLSAKSKFCGECGNKITRNRNSKYTLQSSQKCATFDYTKLGLPNQSELNEDIKLLVFGWCRKMNKRLKTTIPIPIIFMIALFDNIDLFGFDSRFGTLFKINRLNPRQYNVKKIDDYQKATVIFGNKIIKNTFKWSNFNFVFKFKVINGVVNLMFVPSTFNDFNTYISKDTMNKQNYKTLRLINNYNYSYDEVVRVEIDMVKLCANITNKTRNFKTQMRLKGVGLNQIFCAFYTSNPYAEFTIIDQRWQRKKLNFNTNKKSNKYEDSDDITVKIKNQSSNDIMSKPNYNISQIPSNRMAAGLNYIGQCSNHFAICNRGFAEDIRPNDDQCFESVQCNQCNKKFEHELALLHNCKYKICYKLCDGNNGVKKVKDVAFPDYVDIYGNILKFKNYSYLKLDVNPLSW